MAVFNPSAAALSTDVVRAIVAEAMRPVHFYVGPQNKLAWEHVGNEEVAWELFHGRLLDAMQTRQRQTFEAWNVYLDETSGRSAEPLLSIKWDARGQRLFITRAIYSYAWEGYDAGDNVFLSRETRKWLRELIAFIDLAGLSDVQLLRKAIVTGLFQAVVGVSRLPLTSIEAPLPAFSLGELAYFHQSSVPDADGATPMRSPQDLLEQALRPDCTWGHKAKLLETVLRSVRPEDLPEASALFASRWQLIGHAPGEIPALLLTVFNDVALSPYTDFVDKSLAFVQALEDQRQLTPAQHADFLSALLRRLCRHLTAYDLVTFHHRGANYPDALLLDAAWQAYLQIVDRHPNLFVSAGADDTQCRLRRRALRQATMFRAQYEGHEVPDAPTSPGENARVLPAPHVRVPDEQITDPARRSRKLFRDDPWARHVRASGRKVLQDSITDLEHAAELRELGLALFLDRPLGVFKRPGEPDQTTLFSYEAFSVTLAERRLRFLADVALIPDGQVVARHSAALGSTWAGQGLAVQAVRSPARPGTASLVDVLKVADDFRLLYCTRRSIDDFLGAYDWAPLIQRFRLDFLATNRRLLIVSGTAIQGKELEHLLVYDHLWRLRLELEIDAHAGYISSTHGESPAGGLRVLRVWETVNGEGAMRTHDLSSENVRLFSHA